MLSQCEDSLTSLDFMTEQEDGVLLYNGPLENINPLEVCSIFFMYITSAELQITQLFFFIFIYLKTLLGDGDNPLLS